MQLSHITGSPTGKPRIKSCASKLSLSLSTALSSWHHSPACKLLQGCAISVGTESSGCMSNPPLGQRYAGILRRCKRGVSLGFIADYRLSVIVSLTKSGGQYSLFLVWSALNGYVLCWSSDHPRGAMRFTCHWSSTRGVVQIQIKHYT